MGGIVQAAKIVGVEPTYREFEGTPEHARRFILPYHRERCPTANDQGSACLRFRRHESWLPANLRADTQTKSAATGASLGTVTKAFKAWDQSPERAQQVAEGAGTKTAVWSVRKQWRVNLACLDPRVDPWPDCITSKRLAKFDEACRIQPAVRPKSTMNNLIDSWVKARQQGYELVMVQRQGDKIEVVD